MLTKQDKVRLRAGIFYHLDGIVTAPVAFALHKKGVLAHLLEEGKASLEALTSRFNANEGYLNVALRVLCSQGWLEQDLLPDRVSYRTNERSATAFGLVPLYTEPVRLMEVSGHYHPRRFEREPFALQRSIFQSYFRELDTKAYPDAEQEAIRQQVLKHIEGVLVGPTVVHLGMSGMFHKYFMEASFSPDEFHQDAESFRQLLDLFVELGWFAEHNGHFRFTDKGFFFARRASAYGVTVSYIPMFRHMDELLWGDPAILRNVPAGSPELHVDREMNVWGSGGAHTTYFKKIDEIIIDLFNKPIHEQPRGILDMGCGNGAFLQHIYEVIEQRTLRGTLLEEHPLFLVGADYNEAALRVTRANLIQADIWAKIIWGDIGDPDRLAHDLRDNYGIALGDLLNVRTFLDHNRIWQEPLQTDPSRISTSTGAFAHRGRRIPNQLVEESLREHLLRWAPYVARFGLIVIELHTIDPALAAANLGRTAVTAYDATHGFSDQYIVEVDVFRKVAAEAGLQSDPAHFWRFPDSELATVSIHRLRG
jgi:hypothetical protein